MKSVLFALLVALAAVSAQAGPSPFFVFDNGLRGESLPTIEAQLDLVKAAGFDGLSWRTDAPSRVKAVLSGARQRGLKLFVIYANLDLQDGKLVYDPRLKEIIALCKGTDVMIWPNLTSKQFTNSSPAGDDIAVAGDVRRAGVISMSVQVELSISTGLQPGVANRKRDGAASAACSPLEEAVETALSFGRTFQRAEARC